MKEKKAVELARELLRLNAKPYNNDTCDADATEFETLAIALAHEVLKGKPAA